MPETYLWLIPLLPFAGFLINGTIGRKLPRAAVAGVAQIAVQKVGAIPLSTARSASKGLFGPCWRCGPWKY